MFPSGSPWKSKPVAVLKKPLPELIGYFVFFCQTILFVVGSIATKRPDRGVPGGLAKPMPWPMF